MQIDFWSVLEVLKLAFEEYFKIKVNNNCSTLTVFQRNQHQLSSFRCLENPNIISLLIPKKYVLFNDFENVCS